VSFARHVNQALEVAKSLGVAVAEKLMSKYVSG
jgi:hypothetical protein